MQTCDTRNKAMTKYRAVKRAGDDFSWSIQKKTFFGWKTVESAKNMENAQTIIDELAIPVILYPRSHIWD
jgi:hypothetical protein